jgi:hypothetical protein
MTNLETNRTVDLESASTFLRSNVTSTFKPVAYYDERLDCIRVIIRDCSVSEYRINEYLTIAEDAHPIDPTDRYVGFTVKGIRHFTKAQKKDKPESLELSLLLDQILAELPTYVSDLGAKKIVEFAVNISLTILKKAEINEVPLKMAA